MSTGEISQIFRQQLLLHALPVLASEITPNEGMLVQAAEPLQGAREARGRTCKLGVRSSGRKHCAPRKRGGRAGGYGRRAPYLTLMSEDPKINEIFATELMADASDGQRRKKRSSRRGRRGSRADSASETFDVVVKPDPPQPRAISQDKSWKPCATALSYQCQD
eukprot:752923-Hanusia_phi.AAC.2